MLKPHKRDDELPLYLLAIVLVAIGALAIFAQGMP